VLKPILRGDVTPATRRYFRPVLPPTRLAPRRPIIPHQHSFLENTTGLQTRLRSHSAVAILFPSQHAIYATGFGKSDPAPILMSPYVAVRSIHHDMGLYCLLASFCHS